MDTETHIKSVLDAHNTQSNPWQWYSVRYRRPGSRVDECCFQMHLSESEAIETVKKRNPDWIVRIGNRRA